MDPCYSTYSLIIDIDWDFGGFAVQIQEQELQEVNVVEMSLIFMLELDSHKIYVIHVQ